MYFVFLEEEEEAITIRDVLKHREFYIIWVCMAIGALGISTMDMYKVFGQSFIDDDQFLAMVGALAAVFNCSSRIMWGQIVDKLSFQVKYKSGTR